MTKKYIIFISLGILFIISTVFFVLKRHQPAIESLFTAIPDDASFIVNIKDYTKFRADISINNNTWQELLQLTNNHNDIHLLDSLQQTNDLIKNILSQAPQLLISGHSTGKNSTQLLYYMRMESAGNFKQIGKILQKTPGSIVSERKYNGAMVIDVLLSQQRESLSVCYINGVLLLSKSSILIEHAVRKITAQQSLPTDKSLDELIRSAGKSALINFYLKCSSLPLLGQHFLHPKYNKQLEFVSKFADWIELDLNVKPDIFVFNGFTSSANPENNLQAIFTNQKPQKIEMFGKIPTDANTFTILGISDLKQYLKNCQKFSTQQLKAAMLTDSLKTKYNINLTEDFAQMFENEAGIVFAETANDSATHVFTLFRVNNNETAEKTLNDWVEKYSETTSTTSQEAISEVSIDEDFSTKIFKISAGNFPALLFGSMFEAEGNEYCILSDNYLIFGNSPEALKDYTRNILSNNTLNTDVEFNEFSNYFSSQTNFFFYNKPSLSTNILSTYLKQNVVSSLQKETSKLNNLQAFVFQFNINSEGSVYNNIFIKYAPVKADFSPKTTWECRLDGTCTVKPTLVKNHLTGETEIFAQDDKNNIYLLNKLGRILWKQHIEETILSDIYQIDYHRNHKLQYLFNTSSKLYLIDRNGNEVDNFPVQLKEKATNGLAVFDYDKNREYRIFIACADKKVYMLEKNGEAGKGWKVPETDGTVLMPVQHFRFNAADYIVFSDDKKVYVVNRKGKERVKTDEINSLSKNNRLVLAKNVNPTATCFGITDPAGQVYLINTKGKTTTLDLGKFPSDHFFDAIDLDGDGNSELVLTSGQNVTFFTQKGEKLGQITTDSPITQNPLFYEFSSNKYKIGLVTGSNEKIYLYNSNGELYTGFPLRGNSQFSIGLLNNSENRFNLIVGSNKNFLYNYSVQ